MHMQIDNAKIHLQKVDAAVEAFTVGDDYILDRRLVEADCFGSAGHAAGIRKIAFLSDAEYASLVDGLKEIVGLSRAGTFVIGREQEDVHTAIEAHLTATRGEVGKRIHAGRSRNDQIVAATRLYAKWEVLRLARRIVSLGRAAAERAAEHAHTPMVGRTHMQRAMPSSVGLWLGALAEALADDLGLLWAAYDLNDQCPLGSAASYGVPIPLDRAYVAARLGFRKVQNNVLYVANTRGKIEAAILNACVQVMVDLSRYAQDIMLFSMPEFGYFSVPLEFCTGSSIMPQKRNPCVLELVRARTATVLAEHDRLVGIVKGLPTGYNRDGQETKEPFMKGLDVTLSAVSIFEPTLRRLEVNEQKLVDAFRPEVFATDVALELVVGGMPFRDAYRQVKERLDTLGDMDPRAAIAKKTHAGTTGNLGLDLVGRALDDHARRIDDEVGRARAAFASLLGLDGPSALDGI
jgi:argininosuccinate lyase